MNFLKENNIEFETQKRFKWLGGKSLDFYLPKYNIAIECQGLQHFRPVYGRKKSKEEKEKDFLTILLNIFSKTVLKLLKKRRKLCRFSVFLKKCLTKL